MFNKGWFEYIHKHDIEPEVTKEGNGLYTGDAAIVYDFEASDYLKKDIYRVVEGFTFRTHEGVNVIVPNGYLTDGASVPKIFRSWINPWGRHGRASIIHDLLCDFYTVSDDLGNLRTVEDDELNLIFLEAMQTDEVRSLKKKLIYNSVRLYFGTIRKKPLEKSVHDIEKLTKLYSRRKS